MHAFSALALSFHFHATATLLPGKESFCSHTSGHCVGPRASHDAFGYFLPGIEPRFFGCPIRSLVTLPTELFWLLRSKPCIAMTQYFCFLFCRTRGTQLHHALRAVNPCLWRNRLLTDGSNLDYVYAHNRWLTLA
jgi:hypothetical protein